MKASWNWLCALLPDLTATAADVAERLTLAGLEIEGSTTFGAGLEPILIARVEAIEPHPSRSTLRLVTVDRGNGQQQIVCGAPNVPSPGGLVVLAPLGTHLQAKGITLDARDIGGIRSEGMLCSETELGLGLESDGILVLAPDTAPPGTPLLQGIPSARDIIWDIGVTPNRADALGHLGLAREIAALYDMPFALPTFPAMTASTATFPLHVAVDDRARCPHYGVSVIDSVALGPSPFWLRHRLFALGVRPVSNVVDVTNYLMLLYGQPLHAFDFDRVRGATLQVRRAHSGEPLKTLDGRTRTLDPDDLVIADAGGATALAGVMGGGDSEINAATTRVAVECARFEPRGVRRTARRHGLTTEASHRFERGVDGASLQTVLDHATSLLGELAGGSPVGSSVHLVAPSDPSPSIALRSARLNALLGVEIPWTEAIGILQRLGCTVASFSHDHHPDAAAQILAPSWRADLTREVDLIEEIARVRGLDAIVPTLPALRPQTPRTTGNLERRVRQGAVALGLSEALTYAFVAPRELTLLGAPTSAVTVRNPLSEERSVMRTSLLPGLLEAIRRAQRHGERSGRFFTVGTLFFPPTETTTPLPEERRAFAALLAGPRPGYLTRPEDHDVFDAKAVALELVARTTRHEARVETLRADERPAHLHPRAAGQVFVATTLVGTFGLLHPDVLVAAEIEGIVAVVEMDFVALASLEERVPQAKPIPRLPAVSRDLALVVKESISAGSVEAAIREAAGELCAHVELFDLFRGGAIPAGHRSLAFRVVYRDPNATAGRPDARTLTDAEVDARHGAVVAAMGERLGAVVRS